MTDRDRELQKAYFDWANTPIERYRNRLETWEKYVEIRDGKPPRPTELKKRISHRDLGVSETEFREVSVEGSQIPGMRQRRFVQ